MPRPHLQQVTGSKSTTSAIYALMVTFAPFPAYIRCLLAFSQSASQKGRVNIKRDNMKTNNIDKRRSLKLEKDNDEIRIQNKGTKNAAAFTPTHWASFVLYTNEIDTWLSKLTQGEDVAYHNHHGGGWHVSLTKGFRCIDLRKFCVPFGETNCKATKTQIALRLHEWTSFKQAMDNLNPDNLTAGNDEAMFNVKLEITIAACAFSFVEQIGD